MRSGTTKKAVMAGIAAAMLTPLMLNASWVIPLNKKKSTGNGSMMGAGKEAIVITIKDTDETMKKYVKDLSASQKNRDTFINVMGKKFCKEQMMRMAFDSGRSIVMVIRSDNEMVVANITPDVCESIKKK